jgi:hypothetical protein
VPDARGTDPLSALAGLEGVGSAMAATRDGIDALLRDRGLRRTAPDLTGESLLRGAHASAVLSGSESSLEQVRDNRGDRLADAALRVSTELLSLVPVLGHSPQRVMARLHTLAAKGEVDDADLGRPRRGVDTGRLAALARLLTGRSQAPALVLAAVVHAELHTLAAFVSHNDVVARAAERLVLVARGVDPTSLTVPEAGHLALRPQYESNLVAYSSGGRRGVQAWLLYAAEAYAAGAEASPLRDPQG